MSTDIALFKAIGAKMGYLGQRQRIISQNVANADTPNYRPMDLKQVDFGTILKNLSESKTLKMTATNIAHIGANGKIADPKSMKQKKTYEVAPAGNAVIMEEQLLRSGQTLMDYNLMTSLYQKNVRLIQTALGV